MQWCTLGEALANPGHTKGEHSYGGIWGGKGASFHHNFLCHMQNRTPRFNGARYNWQGYDKTKYANSMQAERVDFRNCVIYNWGTGGCYGGPGGGYVNIINNFYKAGPGTLYPVIVSNITVANSGNGGKDPIFYDVSSRYFVHGNYVASAGKPVCYDWKGMRYDSSLSPVYGKFYTRDKNHYYGDSVTYIKDKKGNDCVAVDLSGPIEYGEVTTHKAEVAYEKVLKYGGASYRRDAVDSRYMEEARSKTIQYTGVKSMTYGIIDSINAIGAEPSPTCPSFPELKSEVRPAGFDTDGDGMPDAWEKANKLNPNDPSDGNAKTLDPRGWYTNLEVYLNSIVEPIVRAQNANALKPVNEYYPKCKK